MSDKESQRFLDDAATEDLGKDRLRDAYQQMVGIRRFEERAAREYASGRISGFCHLYIGQEAVAVGTNLALEAKDHMITAYRDHGHALIRGCTPRNVMAELMGKVTGNARGRGGSMHMFAADKGFHGGHGIVGGHIPLATGIGWASRYEKRGEVVVCFFGEGALNQGAFYESLNLAALWKLPVVYIVENNRYAMGTSLERASAVVDLYKKADAFGMPGVVVDGMDVSLVHKTVKEAADRAREESIPTFIEARCYRFRGHSMSDPAKYRTNEEVEERKLSDPIVLVAATLKKRGWATDEELEAWDDAAKEAAADASDFAIESPQPDLKDVGRYVYAEPLQWSPDAHTTPHVRD
ncbi:MAG: pyruvate dehydrogenase (acetyl-transferring) E1 component subunit alpha [Myxococcales bacterium]|nr:pyruvate dehydrogenase (acetyl-transferring) E1 component subunit alpha [Myxococcales bacterium]MCB9731123.1 pyruvate dehydrogenase (acetyl-transferring) E1 component subunit alpha [Deltaproteobacteria bacterium]